MREVEALVNRRLEELDFRAEREKRSGITDARLLILALLNITDEYLDQQQELSEIGKRSEKLLTRLPLIEPN